METLPCQDILFLNYNTILTIMSDHGLPIHDQYIKYFSILQTLYDPSIVLAKIQQEWQGA